jgi:hypothetical protein
MSSDVDRRTIGAANDTSPDAGRQTEETHMQNVLGLYQYAADHQRELIAEADQQRLLTAAQRARAANRSLRSRREHRDGAPEQAREPATSQGAGNLGACGSPAVAPARP